MRCLPLLVFALASACRTAAPVKPGLRIVHSEDSSVGRVYVVDEGDLRYLRFDDPDGDDQSVISTSDPAGVPMDYVRLALVGLAHAEQTRRVLMIGLGAGTFTTVLWRSMPEVEIDAVEVSPVVYRVAREYFGLPDDSRYRIHLQDGRDFVRRTERRYDLVFIDAYTEQDAPAHIHETSFFAMVRERLAKGGAAVINLAVEQDEEERIFSEFASVFACLACYETEDGQNLVVVGTSSGRTLSEEEIRARAARLTRRLGLGFDLGREAGRRTDCGLTAQPSSESSKVTTFFTVLESSARFTRRIEVDSKV